MATLPISPPLVPPLWQARPAFARLVSLAEGVLNMVAEANRLAGAARARYPSAD